MRFTCEKSVLSTAVGTAARAAAAKSSVPYLEGLLIEAFGSITITGYDMKTGIRSGFDADIIESGSIVINARLFGEIIRKLPDNIVEISSDSSFLTTIKCSASEFSLMGFSPEDYPDLPDLGTRNGIRIKESDLKSMISRTSFAVSNNEARPIHTGALFELTDGVLTIVAVDGYRLALRRERIADSDTGDMSFVVPGTALIEVERILSESDDLAKIYVGEKHIMFTIGRNVLISRKLEGSFMNYKNAVPASSKYNVIIDRRSLISSFERVSLMINESVKSPVRCVFKDGVITLFAQTSLGKAYDECACEGDGEGLEIGFNSRYMLDALRAAPADKLKVQVSTGISPCVMVPTDDGRGFLYMVLPVRLRAGEG